MYGELLGKIADNETRIASLKQEADELFHEHKELEDQEKELFEMRRKETVSVHGTFLVI